MAHRCPGCNHPLPPDAEDCPNCPMSFRKLDGPPVRRYSDRSGFGPLAWLLTLGIVGYVGWRAAARFMDFSQETANDASASVYGRLSGERGAPAASPAARGESAAAPAE